MSDLPTPINRNEQYLNAIANGDPSDLPTPITREEQYLDYIAKNGGGSGGAGVSSFNGRTGAVVPKPGDYTAAQVGALPANTAIPSKTSDLQNDSGFVTSTDMSTALASKQDTLTFDNTPTENSNNPVKSGGVYSADKAISDTMAANGAHNLADIPDTTIASGGYIVAAAPIYLSAGSYVLTFDFNGTSGASQFIIWDANSIELVNETFTVANGANELSFTLARDGVLMWYYTNGIGDYSKFMIRLATDPSTAYTPYAMTNRELTERVGEFTIGNIDGNQTIASLQANVNQTGISSVYMVDSLISEWCMVIAKVFSQYRAITIIGANGYVFTHSEDNGATWVTSNLIG